MLCTFCNRSHRGPYFQFVPSVRHQSAHFYTSTRIFRKSDIANAIWTRYLETPIFHHCSVVLEFHWVQQRLLPLVIHTSKCEFCYFRPYDKQTINGNWLVIIYAFAVSFPPVDHHAKGKSINWPWLVQNLENPQQSVVQQWIITQSSKRMHPTTANLPIAHAVHVRLPQIGNCTNLYFCRIGIECWMLK